MNFKQMLAIMMDDKVDSDYHYDVASQMAWLISPDGIVDDHFTDWLWDYIYTGNETEDLLWDKWTSRNK